VIRSQDRPWREQVLNSLDHTASSMAESAAKSNIVRFGLFELDLQARELRKSGILIKLQEQPFQILAMLLERPGEIVTREELQKRLWPGDTFVDFDLSLNSAVKKLRQALNDDSENPRFIETLYRRGYRFIGSANGMARLEAVQPPGVMFAQATPTGSMPAETASGSPSSTARYRKLLLLSGALALLGLAAVFWFGRSQPPRVLGYTQITHDGRLKGGIVTDGERLYFQELDGDQFVVAQVSASGGETATLPTPFENVGIGDISPDGSALLVSNFKGMGLHPLWSLPLPAGTPRRIGDLSTISEAWSPDGSELAFSKNSEIYLAKSDGTDSHKLATAAAIVLDLRFSPDGKRLRFDAYNTTTASSDIWELNRDGTGLHSLLPGWNPTPQECCGNWTRDGKYYVFQSFRKGANNIWALPEKSHWFGRRAEPVQLTNGPLDFSYPVPSKDGKRIFSFGAQPRDELLRWDAKAGLGPFFGGTSAIDLGFSPDGQWVAYVSIPEHILWRSRVDGREPLQLTSSSMYAGLPRWSPDGKQIVFMGRTINTNYRAYLISAGAGEPRELIPGAEVGFDPGWSPDGRSIILSLNYADLPGGSGISILDLASKKLSQLPASQDLFSPRWSPDGKYVAAITKDSERLILFELSTQKWTDLATLPAIGFPTWSRDGQYLYFDTTFTEDPGFFRVRVSDHKLEKLLSLKGVRRFRSEFGPWTGLAPDDSILLARDISSQEIYALDWQAP
jgi:Tol biopolymer transport system component/DNA-binding winged helix-turn-helix (wHTH) protein